MQLRRHHQGTLLNVLLFCSAVLGGLGGGTTSSAWAQTTLGGISIDADKMSRDTVKSTIELSGNVQVIFQGQHLSCDRASINLKTREVEAIGNVILQNQKVHAEGERLKLNYDTNLGTLYRGFIKAGQVLFEGEVIDKVGEDEYVADQAYYSACATCPPAWSFTGSKIKAEIGGYASIDYPVLRIGDVPVFILPWILVPLKSARQSGFLVPKFYFNDAGKLGFAINYFWAIARNQDATISLTKFEKRGIKPHLEYRYVLSEASNGFLRTSFFEDKVFERRVREPATPDESTLVQQKKERWFLNYHHYYEMPEQITHRADLDLVSDIKYARDFPRDLDRDGEPALENRVSVTRNFERAHISGEVDFYINQLIEDPLEENRTSVHRFPEVRFSLIDRPLGRSPVYLGFDSHYIHFSRRHFAYDDVVATGAAVGDGFFCPASSTKCISRVRDGAFEPSKGDLLRTGHRFEFKPRLAIPFRIGSFLEVLPTVSYQETQYRFTAHTAELDSTYVPTAARRFVEVDVGAKTRFSHVFGDLEDRQASRYKHLIEPEIRYSTIPWIRRPNHYFFGQFEGQPYSQTHEALGDDDFFGLNKVQFDYNDRVFDRQLVDFGVTNRIIRKRWHNDQDEYSTLGLFRLSQSYDINEADRPASPQPWSTINGLLDVRHDFLETHLKAEYYPYARVTNSSTRLKFKDSTGNFVQLAYTRKLRVDKDNKLDFSNRTNNVGLTLGWLSKYLNLLGGFDYSRITSKIFSWKYEAQIKPPGNCWDIRFSQLQLPEGKPEFEFGVNFQFGGE